MNPGLVIALIILCGPIASGKEESAYDKAMSLKMAYDSKDHGVLTITLANISDSKLKLMLNTTEVEGEFLIRGAKEKKGSFYDKDYFRKLLTSQWISGFCEVAPKKTVHWTVKLDELVYYGVDDRPVTSANLAGKSFSLKLDRLAVFPAPNKSSVYVDLRSNTVTIPKLEQEGDENPVAAPESKAKGGKEPKSTSGGCSQ